MKDRMKWYGGYKLGTPSTNGLSQMNSIVSKNEIKELKQKYLSCDSATCIFHSIFFLNCFWDLQYKTGNLLTGYDSSSSQDMPRAAFSIFSIC